MAASLINVAVANIGTTEVIAYTVPAGKSSMLLGCLVSNVLGTTAPITVTIRKGAVNARLAKERRIANTGSEEFVKGKIVLASGDKVVLQGAVSNCFDALLSLAEGV